MPKLMWGTARVDLQMFGVSVRDSIGTCEHVENMSASDSIHGTNFERFTFRYYQNYLSTLFDHIEFFSCDYQRSSRTFLKKSLSRLNFCGGSIDYQVTSLMPIFYLVTLV